MLHYFGHFSSLQAFWLDKSVSQCILVIVRETMIHEFKTKYKNKVARFSHKIIDFMKEFYVLELTDGSVYIQTTVVDFDEDVVLSELLYSAEKEADNFVLVDRVRSGNGFHEMKSYPRDTSIPMWSMVKVV